MGSDLGLCDGRRDRAYGRGMADGQNPKPAVAQNSGTAPLLDRQFVIGSVFFGAGWGIAGLCPGPAIASLSFGGTGGLGFMQAMAFGMVATPRLRSIFFQQDPVQGS